jgi:RHH-type transcriptional regulator, proline utilization regulon repressor / proline dehydrogenase / delta 1-pyrroline-5-carboxylate dehydrogenase
MRRELLDAIRRATFRDEAECVADLVRLLALPEWEREAISGRATELVNDIRAIAAPGLMEKFLAQYGLNTDEGVALMCLAEAYLRTPDAATLDALISDKIGEGDWARHLGRAESALVNASTWALMLTGKVFRSIPAKADDLATVMHGVVRRLGEPVARTAVAEAMRLLGKQFVLGRDIDEALANARPAVEDGYLHSFDMLGEAARTARDASRYFASYANAITAIGNHARQRDAHDNPGISVKLSALHPRYETVNRERVMCELAPRVVELARLARSVNVPMAVDAEEADRLELSLHIFEAMLREPSLAGWDGLGMVVQAYARRAPAVIDCIHALCAETGRRVSVRLVKGAYWDSEIKHAQVQGSTGYPVFTRKETTDLSWLACGRKLLGMTDRIYPQFATHNAHSVTAIAAMAKEGQRIEFQRLHGMGETLHELARARDGHRRRIYAPVGVHKDLLAYLVRRLLENGANSSFVHRILDKSIPASEIAADPVAKVEAAQPISHPAIPLPADLFAPARRNSRGINLMDPETLDRAEAEMAQWQKKRWGGAAGRALANPANQSEIVGHVVDAGAKDVHGAITRAAAAFPGWAAWPVEARAKILEKTADLYESHSSELMALAVREAGKTRFDAVAEIREAVDFMRYYAAQARVSMGGRKPLGVVACISPWNFPLAIFTGQVAGALAAGNTVVAKPAEQTPLIAARAARLFVEAGMPAGVLEIVQGDGAAIGPALTGDKRLAGIAFTGSTDTARAIELSLARDGNASAPFIAETGGLNAMIVDSTALPEQAVRDILSSAFQSAGQRCSALRVLFVQRDVAPQLLEMLEGAARELSIGDPWLPSTDVGPVIDEDALAVINAHCEALRGRGREIFRLDLPTNSGTGTFVAPAAYRLDSMAELEREIFGPVLHVVEFGADEIDKVIDAINAAGYGLTLGIHSRIDTRVDRICERARIGNIYVNRNQIGAVVGVQPFGGEHLSGTGPKAGGPHYLTRFTRAAEPRIPGAAPRILAGPTGERNSYALEPRGTVACLGPSAEARNRQAELARASGNTVVEGAPGEAEFDRLLAADGIDAVMVDGEMPREWRMALAGKLGRRIPVVATDGELAMLMSEWSVSEDTTASGGNASLLSAVS